MIKCIAYGVEKEKAYFVQTCCNEEHIGEECDCVTLGENLTEQEAIKLATRKAMELNVPVKKRQIESN